MSNPRTRVNAQCFAKNAYFADFGAFVRELSDRKQRTDGGRPPGRNKMPTPRLAHIQRPGVATRTVTTPRLPLKTDWLHRLPPQQAPPGFQPLPFIAKVSK